MKLFRYIFFCLFVTLIVIKVEPTVAFAEEIDLELSEPIELTEQEMDWLDQKHTVRIGFGNWPPIMIIDESSDEVYSGIVVDYIDTIFGYHDIDYEYTTPSKYSFAQSIDAISNKTNIDMLPTAKIIKEKTNSIAFTQTYIRSPWVVLTRDDSPFISSLDDLSGKTIAIPSNYTIRSLLEETYPDINLLLVDSSDNITLECLKKLAGGEVDAYVENLTVSSYIVEEYGLTNIKIAAPTPFELLENSIAIRNDWPELVSIINKTLDKISMAKQSEINNKWLNIRYEHGIQWFQVVIYIIIASAIFSIIIFFIARWNKRLRREIESRKSAEKLLIESEKNFKSMFEDAPMAYQSLDEDGRLISINKAWLDMLGYKKDEVIGKWFGDFVKPEDKEHFSLNFPKFKNDGFTFVVFEIPKKNGGNLIVNINGRIAYNDDGSFRQTHCLLQNISEQLKSETKLKRQEEEQRLLLEQLQVGIFVHSAEGKIIYCNCVAEKILGTTFAELSKKTVSDNTVIFYNENAERLTKKQQPIYILMNAMKPISNYIVGIKDKKNNELKWLRTNGYPIFENDKLHRVVLSFIDITENKNNEEAIIESEIKHKAMISNITDVIEILRKDGTIKYVSPNIKKYFGWSPTDLIGKDSNTTVHPEDKEYIASELQDLLNNPREKKEGEYRYLCKDGSIKMIHLFAINLVDDKSIDGILINYRDITEMIKREKERKQIEVRLNQQQRLESIGTLAGGVAHEINNPINGIMNYSQIIKDIAESNSEIYNYADEIIHETDRISNIVKNLLKFSRNEKQKHSYANIDDIVQNTAMLIRTIIKHDQIDLQIDIPKGMPKIKCRSQQIQQVIMNLLTNARDSLNEKYPGYHENKIIKLYCEQFTKEERKWIRITLEDFGIGIEKSIQSKIFNPFFSTKGRDKGTGLGLSISFGIVKDHHGEITFETERGNYTRFYINLPCDNGWVHKNQ